MKLYRTRQGVVVDRNGTCCRHSSDDWDRLLNDPHFAGQAAETCPAPAAEDLLPPIGRQEVWAAGVTYLRSRTARMEESEKAGSADFYAMVYDAQRPELFFKAPPYRVIGPGGAVRIRRDSRWNVPEPELTLAINRAGKIVGYTIGNDMSSRDIEGENPLYLPQAKMYDGSCALGPCVLVPAGPLPLDTPIRMEIRRQGRGVFEGATELSRIKRSFESLSEYLFREMTFADGVFLMTGTGIVPPNDFTLALGDVIRIEIPPIGTLINTVA